MQQEGVLSGRLACDPLCKCWLFHSYRLGQVAWTIHIISTKHSNVKRQQLQWNDRQDSLKAVNSSGHLKSAEGVVFYFFITFIAN